MRSYRPVFCVKSSIPDEMSIASMVCTDFASLFVITPEPQPKSYITWSFAKYSFVDSIIFVAVWFGSGFDLLDTRSKNFSDVFILIKLLTFVNLSC